MIIGRSKSLPKFEIFAKEIIPLAPIPQREQLEVSILLLFLLQD